MTDLSPPTLHAISWTLLHFLWQGAALGALLAASLPLTRNANVRYALGVATLMLMLVAPVVTFVWLMRSPLPVAAIETSLFVSAPDVVSTAHAARSESMAQVFAAGANRQDMMLWLVQAWLVGVMLFSVRTAGGWLWLRRARRGQVEPLSDEMYRQCLALQQRMGLRRHVRFGQCDWLDAPAVLGWFRPVVLVTTQAITGLSPQQLQAIIVHELAHIRRHDAFVNLFQIAAELLLFYHPAVWWVSRRIRIEREVCCDNEALAACAEPVNYARALTLMEEWRSAPSMVMAANAGPLTERVLRLLGVQRTSAHSRVAGVGISIAGVAAALFAGNILVAAAQPAAEPQAPSAVSPPAEVREIDEPPPVVAPPSVAAPAQPPEPPAPESPKQVPPPPSAPEAPGGPEASYIDRLASVGLKDLSIDELVALEALDITPEYIQSMLASRLHPNVDELIAMKVQEVTPEYIDEARRVVVDPGIEDVIAMKVHGITPTFIREIQAAGLDIRVAEDVIAAAVHDITPEFVKKALEHGFQDLTVEKLILLRDADII